MFVKISHRRFSSAPIVIVRSSLIIIARRLRIHSLSSLPSPPNYHNNNKSQSTKTKMSGNNYIVVFNDEVTQEQIDKYVQDVKEGGGQVNQRFDAILNGFSATIPDKTLDSFKSLQGDVIKYIEPDQTVTIQK
ncbi:hypothetical protein ACEPAI_7667 [Sanghuangporus weigelae]